MAVMKIRKIGDPILRSETKKIENISQAEIDLIENMVETMYKNDGVGLAAPQVGVLKKIFVVDVGDKLYKFINPVIIDEEGKTVREEGCLSIPDQTGLVARAEKIIIKGLNPEGEEIKIEADDLLARAIQHEIDHLSGDLFVDRMIEPPQFSSISK